MEITCSEIGLDGVTSQAYAVAFHKSLNIILQMISKL